MFSCRACILGKRIGRLVQRHCIACVVENVRQRLRRPVLKKPRKLDKISPAKGQNELYKHWSIQTFCVGQVYMTALDITATNSGNWGDPTIWNSGTVPGTNDDADVPLGIDVTVTTNASVQYIYDGGTVTMASNATLNVVGDPLGAEGTQDLGLLVASAAGNTVIYSGNAFWAKHQDYYNLVLSGGGTLYNGEIGQDEYGDGAVAMTIAGNMIVSNRVSVQEADDFNIQGNLILGGGGSTNITWDCSVANLTVYGNTTVGSGAKITDNDGALGNDTFSNVTVNAGGDLYLLDSTNWFINGSLTNNSGTIGGVAYASINFNGTGIFAGTPITLPTFTINGTYAVGTRINLLTNTPGLNGTLVFDVASPQEVDLATNAGSGPSFYYNGNLDVINSGPTPMFDANYQFFNAQSYAGGFNNITLPNLSGSLSWVNNLYASGSLAITGGSVGAPVITSVQSGNQLILTWDSVTYPGFQVQSQTNSTGIGPNWGNVSGGGVSPFVIPINPANPAVFFRLSNQ
jgi:hypothetical protein